jgi:hypothetical protein
VSVTASTDTPEAKTSTERVFQVLGVTAGLAGTAYFVGGTVMWLRLRIAGFPADLILGHFEPRTRLIGLGVRSMAVVSVVSVVVLMLVNYLRGPGRWIWGLSASRICGCFIHGGLPISTSRLTA